LDVAEHEFAAQRRDLSVIGEAVGDGPPQRDVFYFPPGSRLWFARDATLVRIEIEMAVHGPANAVSLPPRHLVIEAAPRRLHRFEMNSDPGRPSADVPGHVALETLSPQAMMQESRLLPTEAHDAI